MFRIIWVCVGIRFLWGLLVILHVILDDFITNQMSQKLVHAWSMAKQTLPFCGCCSEDLQFPMPSFMVSKFSPLPSYILEVIINENTISYIKFIYAIWPTHLTSTRLEILLSTASGNVVEDLMAILCFFFFNDLKSA